MPSVSYSRHNHSWKSSAHCLNAISPDRSTDSITARAAVKPYLTAKCRQDLLKLSWDINLNEKAWMEELAQYDRYFHHYEGSCEHLPTALDTCTHEHLGKTASLLTGETREEVENAAKALLPTSFTMSDVSRCIEFVTKAVLMIDSDEWLSDETFREYVTRKLGPKSTQPDRYRLPRSFNIDTFARIAGISTSWTRDLFSHLVTRDDNETISIFHNMQILDMYQCSRFNILFPGGSIDELRKSIWLMLPLNDRLCEKFVRREQLKNNLGLKLADYKCLPPIQRNIADFHYWRDRLIIAKDAFDNSQPAGLRQFWHDDRNKVQWWTFWVALVVFLLTLVGVIEGALQVYKAYYPTK